MSDKQSWWQLYLFTALALVVLFLIPTTDKSAMVLWMLVTFGGIALWLGNHSSLPPSGISPIQTSAVEEFFDPDRVYWQHNPSPAAHGNAKSEQREAEHHA